MPKGVDHTAVPVGADNPAEVQKSLMPKGVDHPELPTERFPTWNGAKIFDAERR